MVLLSMWYLIVSLSLTYCLERLYVDLCVLEIYYGRFVFGLDVDEKNWNLDVWTMY